jgi:hypothetical protein
LKWLRFDGIEELRAAVQKELKKLTNEVIASLTGYPFILEELSVAGISEIGIAAYPRFMKCCMETAVPCPDGN